MDINQDSYKSQSATSMEAHGTIITPSGPMSVPCEAHLVSDGYHTFSDLYDHIDALFARLCMSSQYPLLVWKSLAWKCLQGTESGVPSFLAGIELPPYGVVARYLPMPIWERLNVLQVKKVAASWSTKNSSNIPTLLGGKAMPKLKSTSNGTGGTITTPHGELDVPCPTGMVSSGFDSFDDLYELRHALFIGLSHLHLTMAWKSLHHEDGNMFDDYFVAGIKLSEGMITYHLPIELWDLLDVNEVDSAPAWDGHTPNDVVDRLLKGLPEGACLV